MTEADGTSGKRGVKPPPIISNAPEGFAGAPPGSSDAEQRQALYIALGAPLAAAFVLFIVVQWIEQSRCADSTSETACSSDSSGSSGHGGGSGGGGEWAARFGGFGAFGAGHGGGG
ncbi:hypothetical protein [Methylocystis sp. SC2]|uniref:hypothetical protein n=1 Tax=Methylocystis sp. (strain SC2) TaxID=187303 RepID=UPI00027AEF6E|nr:hypothetical protein [Methylocystis sp. SC2]CCJ08225.1 Hypothetical protein BN69_2774 [Methylocystis sp. SC2]